MTQSYLDLEWVNHASFLLRRDATTLICGPWLEGTAFKDGWEQISATRLAYDAFHGIDYVWFSHQHPDHFAPANLRRIDAADRKRITVLYQETGDRLVANWCKSAGFGRIVELPLREWVPIDNAMSVMCGAINDDSWLAIRTPERTLLNVNDCVLKNEERIRPIADAVGHIDVLFTQFSYAQWTGNPPERERRKEDALEKLERIALQVRILDPQIVVPFASFVYFCHEENFFLNDGMNSVGEVAQFVEDRLQKKAVVLYPGDRWNAVDTIDWHANARAYESDLNAKIAAGPTHFRRTIAAADVEDAVNRFLQRLRKKNPYARRLIADHCTLFLTDSAKAYDLSVNGMRPIDADEFTADIATSGENLLYAIKTPWGGNTMHVSGRFVSWRNQHERFFTLMRKLQHYNVTPVNAAWVVGGMRRALRAIGRRMHLLRPKRTGAVRA